MKLEPTLKAYWRRGQAYFSLQDFDAARGVWLLRLILDRRPRNADEAYVPMDDRTPHGSLLAEIVLPPGHELRAWLSDLPQFYYRMQVTPERTATNVFGSLVDGGEYRHLAAVRKLIAQEGLDPDGPVGPIRFALGTMAMGDRNATAFGQAGHIELLPPPSGRSLLSRSPLGMPFLLVFICSQQTCLLGT